MLVLLVGEAAAACCCAVTDGCRWMFAAKWRRRQRSSVRPSRLQRAALGQQPWQSRQGAVPVPGSCCTRIARRLRSAQSYLIALQRPQVRCVAVLLCAVIPAAGPVSTG